jgi:hypothetical protein
MTKATGTGTFCRHVSALMTGDAKLTAVAAAPAAAAAADKLAVKPTAAAGKPILPARRRSGQARKRLADA